MKKARMELVRPVLQIIWVLLCAALLGFSIYKMATMSAEYQEGEEVYDAMAQLAAMPNPTAPAPPEQSEQEMTWPDS